ncbi:MAG: thiosulfate oxidation carrier complex protein SoxZ [Hyphomicrobiaceae bacterium]|nr:thiosulfate oxidation carrier complex protein SoxZ [Hyphomicrobiaceae bacterium]
MSLRPRVKLPETIKPGEIIEIKTLISHIMETGQRKDKDGASIPRRIINAFRATFEGREVFRAELHPGTSANPYIVFTMKVERSGELALTWTEDGDTITVEKVSLKVVA